MYNHTKTVVHVWKQTCRNYPNSYWGIGDMIRGSIGLYQFCKYYGINLIVDISQYPVSKFLKSGNSEHIYSDIVKRDKDLIDFVANYEYHIHTNFSNENCAALFFSTNSVLSVYDRDFEQDIKDFVKNILQPTEEIENYIENLYDILGIKNKLYKILHYRLGDEEIVNGNKNNKFNNLYQHFLSCVNEGSSNNPIILLSDSLAFKNYVKSNYVFDNLVNLKLLNFPICHLGVTDSDENIKNTLAELIIATRSSELNTYSVYSHISGFVYFSHKIYDIPIKCGVNLQV